jgi:hypothetical protein
VTDWVAYYRMHRVAQVIMGADRCFTFDSILTTNHSQEECYKVCASPLLDSFFDGFNATVLAYGQTGV